MAKFDAATAVEALEYDFTSYGGEKGIIPEPTTGAVNRYFANIRALVKDAQSATAKAQEMQDLDLEEMDEDEISSAFDSIDSSVAEATGFQTKTIQAVAELCGAEWLPNPDYTEDADNDQPEAILSGGHPSFEELNRLPIRVLQAFNKWLMAQINPKEERQAAERPATRDHQTATKRSRKGRG